MDWKEKINELLEATKDSMPVKEALYDAFYLGFRMASDKAYEFIKDRTPEEQIEQMSADYIKSMIFE